MQTMPMSDRVRAMSDPTGGGWAWAPQPEARRLIEELLILFLERCPDAARFGESLLAETGTHITDWVGVILTPDTPETRDRLTQAGFTPRTTEFVDEDIHYAFQHPNGIFPDILLTDSDRMSVGVHGIGRPLLRGDAAPRDRAHAGRAAGPGPLGARLPGRSGGDVGDGAARLRRVSPRERAGGAPDRRGPPSRTVPRPPAPACGRRGRDRGGVADRARGGGGDRPGLGRGPVHEVRTRVLHADALRAGSQHARQTNAGLGWANVDHAVYGVGARGWR